MKRVAIYTAVVVAIVGLLGSALSLAFHAPGDGGAILTSAAIAVVVQVIAFSVARRLGPERVLVGWGTGALLRLATLLIYGVLAAKVVGIPLAAGLISLAAFFFISTLAEPPLLKQ